MASRRAVRCAHSQRYARQRSSRQTGQRADAGCPCLVLGYQALLKSVRGAAPNTPGAQAVPHESVDVGKAEVITACAVQGTARPVYVLPLGWSFPRAKRWSRGEAGSAGGALRLPMPDAPGQPRMSDQDLM
jgi:hypothetical protein